jgi:hypothetical protein
VVVDAGVVEVGVVVSDGPGAKGVEVELLPVDVSRTFSASRQLLQSLLFPDALAVSENTLFKNVLLSKSKMPNVKTSKKIS